MVTTMKPSNVYLFALEAALSELRKEYPFVSFEPGYVGILSKQTKLRLREMARADIEIGAPRFRKIIDRAKILERELLSAKFEPDINKTKELFRKLVEFTKLKFLIRDAYGELAEKVLRSVFGSDSPVLDPVRPDIISELQTNPEFYGKAHRVFELPDTIHPINRVIQERYVKKYEEIWNKLAKKGLPPEVLALYLTYLYVYEEAVAFAHREDIPSFTADRVLFRATKYFNIRPIDLWRCDNED